MEFWYSLLPTLSSIHLLSFPFFLLGEDIFQVICFYLQTTRNFFFFFVTFNKTNEANLLNQPEDLKSHGNEDEGLFATSQIMRWEENYWAKHYIGNGWQTCFLPWQIIDRSVGFHSSCYQSIFGYCTIIILITFKTRYLYWYLIHVIYSWRFSPVTGFCIGILL